MLDTQFPTFLQLAFSINLNIRKKNRNLKTISKLLISYTLRKKKNGNIEYIRASGIKKKQTIVCLSVRCWLSESKPLRLDIEFKGNLVFTRFGNKKYFKLLWNNFVESIEVHTASDSKRDGYGFDFLSLWKQNIIESSSGTQRLVS